MLQGAARPPSLAELIFRLHSVACLSSLGPTVLFSMFSSFPDADAKVCVCVLAGGYRMRKTVREAKITHSALYLSL